MPEREDKEEKEKNRADTGRFEILKWKKGGCPPAECPVEQATVKLTGFYSLKEAEEICTEAGLKTGKEDSNYGNPFYGAGMPPGCLNEAAEIILYADCNKRMTEPGQRICGSIRILDSLIQPSYWEVAQTIDYMEIQRLMITQQISS